MKSEVKIAAQYTVWANSESCPHSLTQYNCHKCDNGNKCDKLRFTSICLHYKSEARIPGRVGAGAVWRRVGTLASPWGGCHLMLKAANFPLYVRWGTLASPVMGLLCLCHV
jgi:hypothetical protein